MPSKNLTVAAIDRLPRPTRRIEISDVEKGLFLNVYPSGAKTFVVVYRLRMPDGTRGARESLTLGSYPELALVDARNKAREIMALVKAGKDPKTVKAEKIRADRDESFAAVADAFVKAMRAGKLTGGRSRPVTQDTAEDRASKLKRHVLPVIGSLPLKEVSPAVIGRLLTGIEAKGGPVDNVLKTIRLVFGFAASRAMWTGLPPTHGIKKRQPKEKTARVLSDAELKALWTAATDAGYPFGHAFKLLMLTGQRRDEIATAEWSWVDWDRKLLVVPGRQVKNRAGDHEVPLSAAALAVLHSAQQAYQALGLSSGFIFTSLAGDTPISGWSKVIVRMQREMRAALAGVSDQTMRTVFGKGAQGAVMREQKAKVRAMLNAVELQDFRIHDLRHTFITSARDGDINSDGEVVWSAPLDVVQATVNHEISSGITKAYDHGDLQRRYRLKKRELLDWWSRRIERIVSGDAGGADIIPIRSQG